jgi:hypothetical protein
VGGGGLQLGRRAFERGRHDTDISAAAATGIPPQHCRASGTDALGAGIRQKPALTRSFTTNAAQLKIWDGNVGSNHK